MAKLIGISGITAGREFLVGEMCIIGRSPNVHVRLPDLAVSRHHAKITRTDSEYVIEDLESGYGTKVDDQYVTVSRLRTGNILSICDFTFRFEDGMSTRVQTSEYTLDCNESDVRVTSVDASQFTRFQPIGEEQEIIDRLTRRLNGILAVGQAASQNPKPADLLEGVMQSSLEFFPRASRALVAIPDRKKQSLVVQAMAVRKGVDDTSFSLSRNVISEVLYKGRSVVTQAEGGGDGAELEAIPARSMVVSPLICQGQMLGLIYLDQEESVQPFEEDDLEVLAGIAAHLALALHSAQLRETLLVRSRTAQELSAAHEVQKRFLPRGVPKMAGFTFVAHYDPCRGVGGDLYDFIELDAGHLGIVIGDVSGKGFAAALVMAWVASQLRVAAHQERDPTDVLVRVNEALLEAHQDNLFVTLIYGILDRWTRSFRFCNAGHVPPLVRRKKSQEVEVIETGTGLPVGVVADTEFEEQRIVLDQGDNVLLVTDGVTEAMNPQRAMFGIDGLSVAMANSDSMMTNLVSGVLGELRTFVGEATQYDDITMVGFGAAGSMEDVTTTLPPGVLKADFV